MIVALFGATGMIGQGVLRECLRDTDIEQVLAIGRHPTGQTDPKLRDIVLSNVEDLSSIEGQLSECHACLYCLGVSAVGMSEERYARVTHDLTLAVARTLLRLRPGMTFVYISGAGADSSEKGRVMWARVKGRTENALLKLPLGAAYLFRPGLIIPLHGIRSRTRWYRIFYAVTRPLNPLLRRFFPGAVTTTEQLGRAMLAITKRGYPRPILETRDINSM
jgi:uncharacterized protein YbjT (DUF2867 family)